MSDNITNPRKNNHIDFIGKSVDAARKADVKWRVSKRDGIAQICTCDVRFDRYNFEINQGIITKQYMG